MADIHLVMQGKGGVGKSLLAFYIAQYVREKNGRCLVFDTDPLNQTLARSTTLEAKVVRILADDHITIMKNAFDPMIEECEAEDADVVIDVGAISFVPMLEYCAKNGIYDLWHEMGHSCILHSIVTGKDFADTCDWFGEVTRRSRHVPSVSAVVWLNPFAGTIEKDGRSFLGTVQYKENRDRIQDVIHMPLPSDMGAFGMFAFNEMMAAGETLEEYHRSGEHFIMERQTMIMFKRKLFDTMNRAGFALK